MALVITENLVPPSKYPIKATYAMNPFGICVHNTANDASADNEIAYMVRNDLAVSYHYAVDDIKAVRGIPENRNGWHAGDGVNGDGNRNYIGIEICYSKSGGDRFLKAEQNAVLLIVKILKERGWESTWKDRVKKHQDFFPKYCPHRTLDMGWQRFLDMVAKELQGKDWKTDAKELPEDKRAYIANKDTGLFSLANGALVKEFKKGQKSGARYKLGDYLVTEWSYNNNIANGLRTADWDIVKDTDPEDGTGAPIDPCPDFNELLERVKVLEANLKQALDNLDAIKEANELMVEENAKLQNDKLSALDMYSKLKKEYDKIKQLAEDLQVRLSTKDKECKAEVSKVASRRLATLLKERPLVEQIVTVGANVLNKLFDKLNEFTKRK